ncbi:MAG: hypothetical protein WC223_11315 [Bacteroidales bacterium]|jgi:hypothetical protein
MKPKILHQEAMNFSFKAKESFENGDENGAFDYYTKAANLESKVAEFYFDKPELEPTRSLIIRSAAYLNLKAGLIENSQRFIYFGLLNLKDEVIKNQLNEALELAITLKNFDVKSASNNYEYLKVLRQKSVHYVLEPVLPNFGTAVALEMIKDFSENYIKSLKAFSKFTFKKVAVNIKNISNDIEAASEQFEKLINPLVTNSAYGSFKFSIANDFLARDGEEKEIANLKSNVISKYHDEIFKLQLTDENISLLKNTYADDEINQIFKPLLKIKSKNVPYKVGYYDRETLNKTYLNRILNTEKRKLLPINKITPEDIGFLESSIVHTRSSDDGKKSRNVILREQLKSYEFDLTTNQLEFRDKGAIILNQEILINVNFDSTSGFTFEFDDLAIVFTHTNYHQGLTEFYNEFYNKIKHLANKTEKNENELNDWVIVKRLINNPESIN